MATATPHARTAHLAGRPALRTLRGIGKEEGEDWGMVDPQQAPRETCRPKADAPAACFARLSPPGADCVDETRAAGMCPGRRRGSFWEFQ